MNVFSVAGIQLNVVAGHSNISAMEHQLASLMERFPWVQMAVFPELAVFGPGPGFAERAGGEIETAFQEMASRYGIWLVPGSHSEKCGASVCNTALAISPDGEIVGRYQKQFPFLPSEENVLPGTEFLVFDVPEVGRFGLSICYDIWFPETTRTLAAMGAEIILHPSLTNTIDRSIEHDIIRATAAMNQCYVFDVNGVGDGGYGRSIVAGPSGNTIHMAGENAELFPLPLNLDQLRWERENGILGLGQVLKSFRDRRVQFDVYDNTTFDTSYLDSLGPLELKPGACK